MIIDKNGIKIECWREGSDLLYKILEQSEDASNIIKKFGTISDPQSGFSLRVNNKPSFNHEKRKFFLRGDNRASDGKTVRAQLGSPEEANNAQAALQRLIDRVIDEKTENPEHKKEGKPKPGGTTHCRMAVFTRSQAQELELTAKDYYPDERTWDAGTEPIHTINKHYNEHLSQVVDVLNKAYDGGVTERVVNPHKVSSKQAETALAIFRDAVDTAENDDCLVALWRLVSGIRGPDFIEKRMKGRDIKEIASQLNDDDDILLSDGVYILK